jgi:nucleolar complex protein 3
VLHGISKFAHLVNIDFFKDLMQVLKDLISQEAHHASNPTDGLSNDIKAIRHHLLCIVTAFELLSGQGALVPLSLIIITHLLVVGEALNIDLTDFISNLYAVILPLSLMDDIAEIQPGDAHSVADMLFRALDIVFSPRTAGNAGPSWRSAAFAKRLLNTSLHWPPATALRVIDFVRGLIAKDLKLEALLHTEDRIYDGIYRPDVDDPQLCCPFGTSFWELHALHKSHWHAKVREEAGKLLHFRT